MNTTTKAEQDALKAAIWPMIEAGKDHTESLANLLEAFAYLKEHGVSDTRAHNYVAEVVARKRAPRYTNGDTSNPFEEQP